MGATGNREQIRARGHVERPPGQWGFLSLSISRNLLPSWLQTVPSVLVNDIGQFEI